MITELIGKTFKSAEIASFGKRNERFEEILLQIVVTNTDEKSETYSVIHKRQCCEFVSFYASNINGMPCGSKILRASSREYDREIPKDLKITEEAMEECNLENGSFTWTHIQLEFERGGCADFWFLGSSNGYYSESVNVEKLKEFNPEMVEFND